MLSMVNLNQHCNVKKIDSIFKFKKEPKLQFANSKKTQGNSKRQENNENKDLTRIAVTECSDHNLMKNTNRFLKLVLFFSCVM